MGSISQIFIDTRTDTRPCLRYLYFKYGAWYAQNVGTSRNKFSKCFIFVRSAFGNVNWNWCSILHQTQIQLTFNYTVLYIFSTCSIFQLHKQKETKTREIKNKTNRWIEFHAVLGDFQSDFILFSGIWLHVSVLLFSWLCLSGSAHRPSPLAPLRPRYEFMLCHSRCAKHT